MTYGIENNQRARIAEDIVRKLMEARGFECKRGLETDLVCTKREEVIYIEVKSKLDDTKLKFRRFNQLTSARQEKFLKKAFKSKKIRFKLFVVWFPSLEVKEYDKEELDLRLYNTRLGYIRLKGERLRKQKKMSKIQDCED